MPHPLGSAARLAALAVIAIGSAIVAAALDTPVIWVGYAIVVGFVLTSLFVVVHEATHGSLFGRRTADSVAGVMAGILCLVPFGAYRPYHLEHHVKTHEEGDSEQIIVVRSHVAHVAMVVFAILALSVELTFRVIAILFGRGPAWMRRSRRVGLEVASVLGLMAALGAAAAVGVSVGWRWTLLLWGAPLAVYFPVAGLFSTPEHYGCDYGPGPTVATTRTVRSNALVRACLWNANYHVEHHMLPAVPGRNLPLLHEVVAEHCLHLERSYLGYHRAVWRRIAEGSFPDDPPWREPRVTPRLRRERDGPVSASRVGEDPADRSRRRPT